MAVARPPVPRQSQVAVKPAEVKAQSKLAQIRKGDPLSDGAWPRPGATVQLKIRSLSDEEVVECYARALKYFEDKGIDLQKYGMLVTGAFEDEVSTQMLHEACRNFEDPRVTFAEDVADLRANTTPDERALMVDAYRDHRQSVDPSLAEMQPEDAAALIEVIKKKDIRRLRGFGSCVLSTFLLTTEDPRWTSPSGSAGTSESSSSTP